MRAAAGRLRTGEHGEEGGEEAPPRDVEGARVRVAGVEDDELGRLVLRVNLLADGRHNSEIITVVASGFGGEVFWVGEKSHTGMEKTRPKISFVPRLFTPFFSRAS